MWDGRRAVLVLAICGAAMLIFASCERARAAKETSASAAPVQTVGVVKVVRRPMSRDLTLSSELIPFQEIDVFAKESGFVSRLLVDYGSRVKKGQLLAVLEIPELRLQLDQDRAAAASQSEQVTNALHQLTRIEAQHKVMHLEYERLAGVAAHKPGLVAQQEIDDIQGRDLAAEAQAESAQSNVSAEKSTLAASQAKVARDQALFAYSQITAPFSGVVTQRYANLGTLLASGTNSSTQAMPLVKLSEVDRFRLVIPIPEAYVRYVRLGDPVQVRVPSLERTLPGTVTRFSPDVHDATRTMHTEVDAPNPTGTLIPGVYAEATLSMNRSKDALTVPIQAIDREGEGTHTLVVNSGNQIELRQVNLGLETESEVQILSGLNEGDRVVVSDRADLKNGDTVRAQEAPPLSYSSKS